MNTEFVDIDLQKPLDSQLERAAEIIRHGGLVAFPTETVYGLGASALDSDAAKKIYAAKGRPSDNPLIIHISAPEDAEKYCVTNELYYKLAAAFMPGPLTVIMPKREIIPMTVTGGLQTVAVRCPSNPVANAFIRLSGVPIAAPSANISGRPSPTCIEHIRDDMNGKIDMMIDGGPCEIGLESTIIKITDKTIKLLRPGGITPEQLRSVCGEIEIDKAVTEKLAEGAVAEAPGMKYRHYAPRAKVRLIRGCGDEFDARAISYIKERLKENSLAGALCPDEIASRLDGKYVKAFGSENDASERARMLFSALREFDKTDVEVIYAVVGNENGIGLALYNRMLKAAGYDIIDI